MVWLGRFWHSSWRERAGKRCLYELHEELFDHSVYLRVLYGMFADEVRKDRG
jgi:hypothetical protein